MLEQDVKISHPIEEYLITPYDHIERDQVILQFRGETINWSEVMTAGNISTLIGKAKGRKTFFVTLLIANLFSNHEIQFHSTLTGKVVLFDTEQGKFHVHRLTKRIEGLTGKYPDKLQVYGLRPLNIRERVEIIENYIYQHEPQVVFIDGIRDLVTDINSAEQATEVVGKLMKWSYDTKCHICNVLHQNKADDNARGHIGTEIVNKSESVISINKMKKKNFSVVKGEFFRGQDFKPFKFSVENHLPVIDYNEMPIEEETQEEAPF